MTRTAIFAITPERKEEIARRRQRAKSLREKNGQGKGKR
jgi:hypothetical protein